MQDQTAYNLLLLISAAILKSEGDALAISEVMFKLDAKVIEQLPFSPLTKEEEKSVKSFLTHTISVFTQCT